MRTLCKSLVSGLALALAAACSTPQKSAVTPLVSETAASDSLDPSYAPPIPPVVLEQPAPAVAVEPPPAPEPPPFLPSPSADNPWISWEQWSVENGFGRPQRTKAATNLTVELSRPNGTLVLVAGRTAAQWNGINVELGFLPKWTNGAPFLHALDVKKNISPLLSASTPPFRTRGIVVIDPGHGGSNTGTRCVLSGRNEKDYTLDWALRLKPLLESAGWTVHLTRTNDTDVALSNRVNFADQVRADLFVSLHFNSATGGADGRKGLAGRAPHGGVETYCLTPPGMPSTLAREFEDDATKVYPNNAFDTQNLQTAVRLHRSLIDATARRDRGVKRARFMTVLQGQNRPAVLLEAGYLSDPAEAKLIALPSYRQKLAEAVAKALSE